jgi:hypothetical protein
VAHEHQALGGAVSEHEIPVVGPGASNNSTCQKPLDRTLISSTPPPVPALAQTISVSYYIRLHSTTWLRSLLLYPAFVNARSCGSLLSTRWPSSSPLPNKRTLGPLVTPMPAAEFSTGANHAPAITNGRKATTANVPRMATTMGYVAEIMRVKLDTRALTSLQTCYIP